MQAKPHPDELLLTILVPTWNREKLVRELLAVLLPLVEANPQVELIVSENASPDNTARYLDSLPAHPRVRVFHQPINYGGGLHTAWLYGLAKGRYLWMIGDDDLIEPELVADICQVVRDHPTLGWVHLPHRFGPIHSRCPGSLEMQDRGRKLFAPYFRWITLMTANVIRTDLLHGVLGSHYLDNDYWPTSLLMRAVADHPACVLPGCKVNCGVTPTWADKAREIGAVGLPQTILNSAVMTKAEKRAVLREYYTQNPQMLDPLGQLAPGLLLRVLRMVPQLCTAKLLWRMAGKARRRLTRSNQP